MAGRRTAKYGSGNVPKKSFFKWTKKRSDAAVLLAQGYTVDETAKQVGVVEKTIDRWKKDIVFKAEVDRLSLMIDVASRAERMRIIQRVVRQNIKDKEDIKTNKDLLEWLKLAQSETDGIKLDLSSLLAALSDDAPPVAPKGPGGSGGGIP